jgi:hypothetical protein
LKIENLQTGEVKLLLLAQKASIEQIACTLSPHGARHLAESLKFLLQFLEETFDKYIPTLKSLPEEETMAAHIFARHLCKIHDWYLRYLLPPNTHSFPGELLYALKQFLVNFGGYDDRNTSLSILHSFEYNFGVIGFDNPLHSTVATLEHDLLISPSSPVKSAIRKTKRRLVFLTYPEPEGRNVFWQGILFHELGHAIDWNKDITKGILEDIKWKQTNSINPTILENWIQEIVADLIAIRLVGPAMLFSSRSTSLTVDVLDSDSETHPASRLRFIWMLEHLAELGYTEMKEIRISKILSDWQSDLQRNHGIPPSKAKFRVVRTLLKQPGVRKKIHKAVETIKTVLDAKSFLKHVPPIVRNFREHLPHCGDGTNSALHTAAVFNGIWEASVEGIEPEGMTGEYRDMLCGLALKSIEGKYIQDLWETR